MTWETVIGLEVHAQLNTKSKLFSNSATLFGATPNSQTSLIDAGFPGTLPVVNQQAVHLAIQFGLAINAQINQNSYFERKNYVYPDLPKGYQITQFQRPIVGPGYLDILDCDHQPKRIHILRAHLEEDAGKSIHGTQHTAIDLNRAGIPLLEIVTTPCLSNATEVVHYLKALNQLLRFLNICNGNMQEGSFRCDVNISLKRPESSTLGTRVELKNLNSYRFIEKAIAFEQHRQMEALHNQQTLIQETRLYNEITDTTEPMRDKENENDYRYFPDPDLLPIFISDQLLETLSAALPEKPNAITQRLIQDGIELQDDLDYLLSSPAVIHYYDATKQSSQAPNKLILNWLKGPLAAALKDHQQSFDTITLSPQDFGMLLNHVFNNTISTQTGKQILLQGLTSSDDIQTLIQASQKEGLSQTDIESLIQATIAQYPNQVAQYQSGDEKILSFLIGQVLKASKGKADPKTVQSLLISALS